MKRLMFVLITAACLSQAEEPVHHHWKQRKIAALSQCGMAGMDTLTTFHAASIDPFGHEMNPLLRDANLRPSPWRFAVVKGAICATSWILATNKHVPDPLVVAWTATWGVPDTIWGLHNLTIHDTRTPARIQPGTPK